MESLVVDLTNALNTQNNGNGAVAVASSSVAAGVDIYKSTKLGRKLINPVRRKKHKRFGCSVSRRLDLSQSKKNVGERVRQSRQNRYNQCHSQQNRRSTLTTASRVRHNSLTSVRSTNSSLHKLRRRHKAYKTSSTRVSSHTGTKKHTKIMSLLMAARASINRFKTHDTTVKIEPDEVRQAASSLGNRLPAGLIKNSQSTFDLEKIVRIKHSCLSKLHSLGTSKPIDYLETDLQSNNLYRMKKIYRFHNNYRLHCTRLRRLQKKSKRNGPLGAQMFKQSAEKIRSEDVAVEDSDDDSNSLKPLSSDQTRKYSSSDHTSCCKAVNNESMSSGGVNNDSDDSDSAGGSSSDLESTTTTTTKSSNCFISTTSSLSDDSSSLIAECCDQVEDLELNSEKEGNKRVKLASSRTTGSLDTKTTSGKHRRRLTKRERHKKSKHRFKRGSNKKQSGAASSSIPIKLTPKMLEHDFEAKNLTSDHNTPAEQVGLGGSNKRKRYSHPARSSCFTHFVKKSHSKSRKKRFNSLNVDEINIATKSSSNLNELFNQTESSNNKSDMKHLPAKTINVTTTSTYSSSRNNSSSSSLTISQPVKRPTNY